VVNNSAMMDDIPELSFFYI